MSSEDMLTCRKREKIDRILGWSFFGILFLVASAVTFFLFYQQVYERFPSDMKAYILEIQGLNDVYSFPYPIFFWLGKFFWLFTTPECAMALATLTLNGLGMILMKWQFDRHLFVGMREQLKKAGLEKITWLPGCITGFLAVALFFISMIIMPWGHYLPGVKFKYVGVFTPNPFHNATYMAARPFAILAFFSFLPLLQRFEREKAFPGKKEDIKDCIVFAVCLLAATMAKPSFTIVLVGAAGLNMLYVLFASKFQKFVPTILLGLCFVPTFLALLYQYSGVFVSKEEQVEAGMGFCLGEVWHAYCAFVPSAVVLGMAFPLTVSFFHFRKLKTNMTFRFSWEVYVMSFLMAYFIYEKGFRKFDFNFAWGYMYGIFFGFVGALFVLLRDTFEAIGQKNGTKSKEGLQWGIRIVEWSAFLAHLICGILYFGSLLRGEFYY